MRKSKVAAAETRQRIVKGAADEFRRNGLAGTGLADLMGAALLTHGGFYKHFESKEQVAAEAIAHALNTMIDSLEADAAAAQHGNGLKAIFGRYLAPKHRDEPESGCALAALGSEIARSGEDIRHEATAGYKRLVETIARQLPSTTTEPSRDCATAIVSAMVGAVVLSRLVDDSALSNSLLKRTRQYLLAQS
ncbi:TetR/AcrR family transcriptional regulator [Nevskia soli]|uniref:TetR/AcrR family transcriptional regulator n=1 Tax=Nevskia soli TaxID=418856 RepID=UPI0004A70EAB|nr:TetR/AcrR family transcriptional regulator [Nevskia soli]